MSSSRRILVIVFSRILFDKLEPFLSRSSFEVDTVTGGKGALILLANVAYDLVVVEHPLPDLELGELRAAIRSPMAPASDAALMVLTREEPEELELADNRLSCYSVRSDGTELLSRIAEHLGVAARRAHRALVTLRVEIGPAEFLHACQTIDISESGVLLRCEQELPVDTALELTFSLPGQGQPLQLRGRVARHAREDGRLVGLGVQFVEIGAEDRERVVSFVSAPPGEHRAGHPLAG